MLIKILGPGCAKCNRLEQLTREAVAELGINADFEHVTQIEHIMAYPIMTTPALVVDERVKCSGRIPSKGEILGWLKG
ncbi:MAG: TM0996/MTH895 family glutaredoxin-like protein [Dechloromonas sp.]|jgi:small redox-active disulfide protein 2|nr:MAG: TM0996/MTH895 family glutaredoxin-like protein [Dechloromonas sp.]